MTARETLRCASLGCRFLVHYDSKYGGFCCKRCHLTKDCDVPEHGGQCYGWEAPRDAQRAEPVPPDQPMGGSAPKGGAARGGPSSASLSASQKSSADFEVWEDRRGGRWGRAAQTWTRAPPPKDYDAPAKPRLPTPPREAAVSAPPRARPPPPPRAAQSRSHPPLAATAASGDAAGGARDAARGGEAYAGSAASAPAPEGAAAGGNWKSNYDHLPPAPPNCIYTTVGSRTMLLNMVTGQKTEAPGHAARGRSRSPPACRPCRPAAAADGEVEQVTPPFVKGARVIIRGFVGDYGGDTGFNGWDGKVASQTRDGRYHVSMLGKLLGITLRWVKQENLEHWSPEREVPTAPEAGAT